MKKSKKLSAGQKAARTRARNYANASPVERAKIDKKRSQAATKAAKSKKLQKGKQNEKNVQKNGLLETKIKLSKKTNPP